MTDKTDSKERDALMEAFGFVVEEQDGVWTLVEDSGCSKPATIYERVLWKEMLAGRASLAVSAGSEPVARVNDDGFIVEIGDLPIAPGQKLYLHPSPPEGAGWRPIESFSEDEADEVLAWKPGVGRIIITWLPEGHPDADEGEGWHEAWSHKRVRGITHGMLPPAPPTTSAGSGKGE